jgi:hypothetical protein
LWLFFNAINTTGLAGFPRVRENRENRENGKKKFPAWKIQGI